MTCRRVPSGMYGRCGRKNARPGSCTRPCPNGQMPANTRNRVDLPDPERPVTTTEWPGCNTSSACSSSFTPFGSAIVTSRSCTVPSAASIRWKSCPAAARAATMARWNVVRRSTMARHCASVRIPADEPRQRSLHLAECIRRSASAHPAASPGEVARRGNDERKYHRHLVVACGQRVEQLGALHDAPTSCRSPPAKRWPRRPFSSRLAAIQRDALHVLAHAHQAVAEIRLHPLLAEVAARPAARPTRWVSQVPITA